MKENNIYILQIGMTKNKGGIETYLIQQLRYLKGSNIIYDFVNITGEYDIAYQNEILSNGSKIYNVCSRHRNPFLHYFQWFKLLLKKRNIYKAVVLNAATVEYVYPLFLAKLMRIPMRVIHSHNSGFEHKIGIFRKFLINFNRILLRYSATEYLACSKDAGKWMFGSKSFKIIHNAIDLNEYKFNIKKRLKIRDELQIGDKLVIGHVGRFSYIKNQIFLVKIFYEITKKEKNSILMLIGGSCENDKYLNEVKLLIKQLKLENKVLFLGMRDNVSDFMHAMDCFLMTSFSEGLGIAAVEAQSNGLKCFLSDRICNEVAITDLVYFISLEKDAKYWSDYILSHISKNRIDEKKEIKSAEYNIKEEINKIISLYGDDSLNE